ncbi:MAG: DUF2807 domain-containing protein [Bacteroidia bacterium]
MSFKLKNVLVIITLLLFFIACKKENACDCFKRTGKIITEKRSLVGFDGILVENNLNVFITQDSIFEIIVEAGENIAPLIKTEVQNGTLTCKNDNRCNFTRSYGKPLNIYIKMPYIKYITSNSTGDITSLNTITTDTFNLHTRNSGNITINTHSKKILTEMHGSGDLTITGHTNEHSCYIAGTGFLYCDALQTDYTYIHTFTLGLCYLNVTNFLICKMEQIGDVYCYGKPKTVWYTSTSSGKLYIQ